MQWAKLFLAISLLLSSGLASAIESIEIKLDSAWLTDNTGITGKGIQLSLGLGTDKLNLVGEAEVLQLPAPYGDIKNVQLRCSNVSFYSENFSCQQGQLKFTHAEFGKQNLQFSLIGNSVQAHYQIAVQDRALAEGSLKLTAEIKDKIWTANISSQQLAAPVILALAGQNNNGNLLPLARWLEDATANVEIALAGQDALESFTIASDWFGEGSKAATATLNGKWQAGRWSAEFTSQQLSMPALFTLAAEYSDSQPIAFAKSWLTAATLAGRFQLTGQNSLVETAEINTYWSDLNGSDTAGAWVAESVSAKIAGNWQSATGEWDFSAIADSGQVYGEPIFLDFGEQALSLTGAGKWDLMQQQLEITQATVNQAGVAQLASTAILDLSDWLQSDISIILSDINVPALYEIWLQPFLLSNAAGKMDLSGRASLSLDKVGEAYQMNLTLEDVSAKDKAARFQLHNLSGTLGWTSLADPVRSTLSWQGGQLYAIPFGETTFEIQSKGSQLRLIQAATLPILDGAVTISEFALDRPLDETTKWSFSAELSPISMPLLSEKLKWPALSGKLSGNIPHVSYQQKQITMQGDLSVNLFAGQVLIQDLRLDDPFGALPQLFANVDMKKIDLSLLTETFDFGDITGKLDGYIHDLRLSNWKAVAFDAAFATPDGDKHRRRISQRAVEQLTEVGGGPSAALSKTFLRFFKDFSYQKMGLSCKLRNNVCDMSGVGESPTGYYIVKGGGLPPRINIIGFTRRVDWTDLLARLKAVSESDGPVIK